MSEQLACLAVWAAAVAFCLAVWAGAIYAIEALA